MQDDQVLTSTGGNLSQRDYGEAELNSSWLPSTEDDAEHYGIRAMPVSYED